MLVCDLYHAIRRGHPGVSGIQVANDGVLGGPAVGQAGGASGQPVAVSAYPRMSRSAEATSMPESGSTT
jgi:hypothetical protein